MATQQELVEKLAACRADGTFVHGSVIKTYESESEVMIRVIDKTQFRCSCWCASESPQAMRIAPRLCVCSFAPPYCCVLVVRP